MTLPPRDFPGQPTAGYTQASEFTHVGARFEVPRCLGTFAPTVMN